MNFAFGYGQLPTNTYFSNEYTFMVWIKPNSDSSIWWTRIIEFSTGSTINGIYVNFQSASLLIMNKVFSDGNYCQVNALNPLEVGVWTHVAIVKNGTGIYNFRNGLLESGVFCDHSVLSINRTLNFIGKSYSNGFNPLNACLDDLKIYNIALNDEQLYQQYSL